jgi:CPA1 family monovalent cation:H+ antiporter
VAGENQSRDVDAARAVLISARRAQLELDQLLASGLIARGEHAERRAAFQRDIIAAERILRTADLHSHPDVVQPSVLIAQKAALLDAARRGLISDRTANEHVAALDKQLLDATAWDHSTESER